MKKVQLSIKIVAKEEFEKLQKLESDRISRMKGEVIDTINHKRRAKEKEKEIIEEDEDEDEEEEGSESTKSESSEDELNVNIKSYSSQNTE